MASPRPFMPGHSLLLYSEGTLLGWAGERGARGDRVAWRGRVPHGRQIGGSLQKAQQPLMQTSSG